MMTLVSEPMSGATRFWICLRSPGSVMYFVTYRRDLFTDRSATVMAPVANQRSRVAALRTARAVSSRIPWVSWDGSSSPVPTEAAVAAVSPEAAAAEAKAADTAKRIEAIKTAAADAAKAFALRSAAAVAVASRQEFDHQISENTHSDRLEQDRVRNPLLSAAGWRVVRLRLGGLEAIGDGYVVSDVGGVTVAATAVLVEAIADAVAGRPGVIRTVKRKLATPRKSPGSGQSRRTNTRKTSAR
jgi:hypothetical protein